MPDPEKSKIEIENTLPKEPTALEISAAVIGDLSTRSVQIGGVEEKIEKTEGKLRKFEVKKENLQDSYNTIANAAVVTTLRRIGEDPDIEIVDAIASIRGVEGEPKQTLLEKFSELLDPEKFRNQPYAILKRTLSGEPADKGHLTIEIGKIGYNAPKIAQSGQLNRSDLQLDLPTHSYVIESDGVESISISRNIESDDVSSFYIDLKNPNIINKDFHFHENYRIIDGALDPHFGTRHSDRYGQSEAYMLLVGTEQVDDLISSIIGRKSSFLGGEDQLYFMSLALELGLQKSKNELQYSFSDMKSKELGVRTYVQIMHHMFGLWVDANKESSGQTPEEVAETWEERNDLLFSPVLREGLGVRAGDFKEAISRYLINSREELTALNDEQAEILGVEAITLARLEKIIGEFINFTFPNHKSIDGMPYGLKLPLRLASESVIDQTISDTITMLNKNKKNFKKLNANSKAERKSLSRNIAQQRYSAL